MDDELKSLEAELKRLRPSAPSVALIERIESELARPVQPRPVAPVHWLWAAAIPAAAAIALMWVQSRSLEAERAARSWGGTIASNPDTVLKPIAAENLLVSAQDEGLVTLEDGTPARRARLTYVDTITWKNPRTNASMTWTVPREEVRIVPVRFQ